MQGRLAAPSSPPPPPLPQTLAAPLALLLRLPCTHHAEKIAQCAPYGSIKNSLEEAKWDLPAIINITSGEHAHAEETTPNQGNEAAARCYYIMQAI